VPPEVFGPMLKQPDTIPPNSLRGNLRVARDLLAQAGGTTATVHCAMPTVRR
jgi:hypothetical protein